MGSKPGYLLIFFYFTFRISQTAPASPTIGRSRATSSSVPSGPGGQVDLDNHTFSESSAAASVGHLGEKVKKTIKQVKFVFSEKATKNDEIFTVDLTLTT